MHASIPVVAREWKRAGNGKTIPDLRALSVSSIDTGCMNTARDYPDWPKVLSSTDLSEIATEQSRYIQWWLGDPVADDSGDGMSTITS